MYYSTLGIYHSHLKQAIANKNIFQILGYLILKE